MAAKNQDNQSFDRQFFGEIDHSEIEQLKVIGSGTFGTVYKARWRDKLVAVKYIANENERNVFGIELRQLSRVSHPNIIPLYGACTKKPRVCLVMEYAEGGSLHNVLHCHPEIAYTASHAMSWARQCAEGVAYMHAMRPKPLIHRDLKPLNLLLFESGRILKICDFGTVVDKATQMTNNKGSPGWMAPEVFRGDNYTEKCDVYSWGIIFWEVLSREQPFKHLDSSYRILWNVSKGERPPLFEGCPKPIKDLMTRCWDESVDERPSMEYVVEVMQILCEFFPNGDEPLDYRILDENYDPLTGNITGTNLSDMWTANYELLSQTQTQAATSTNVLQQQPLHTRAEVETSIKEFSKLWPPQDPNSSANRFNRSNDSNQKTISSISTKRNGELKTSAKPLAPLTLEIDPNAWELPTNSHQDESNNQSNERLTTTETRSNAITSSSGALPSALSTANPTIFSRRETSYARTEQNREIDDDNLSSLHLMLEPHLRPAEPDPNSEFSKQIFEDHKRLAKEYLKMQTETAYANKLREEVLAKKDPEERQKCIDYMNKLAEKDELLEVQAGFKRRLQLLRMNRRPQPNNVTVTEQNVPRTQTTQPNFNRQNSNSSIIANEDEWVLVPSQNESEA